MKIEQYSIGKEAAIDAHERGWWNGKTVRDIAVAQMFCTELCMPFDKFHSCMEVCLGRPIFTHSFAIVFYGLVSELLNGAAPPTKKQVEEIIGIHFVDDTYDDEDSYLY